MLYSSYWLHFSLYHRAVSLRVIQSRRSMNVDLHLFPSLQTSPRIRPWPPPALLSCPSLRMCSLPSSRARLDDPRSKLSFEFALKAPLSSCDVAVGPELEMGGARREASPAPPLSTSAAAPPPHFSPAPYLTSTGRAQISAIDSAAASGAQSTKRYQAGCPSAYVI